MNRDIKFLGIDVGTGGTRALITDERGKVVASGAEEHTPFASPQLGWAEQIRRGAPARNYLVRPTLASSRPRHASAQRIGRHLIGKDNHRRPIGAYFLEEPCHHLVSSRL
ncbi:MAG: hypothetical protein LAO30_02475 [Acidobacteriia bacterium]|nr:hypothetical protein [Terriglobia bacterium]